MPEQSFQLVIRTGPTPGKIYELSGDDIGIDTQNLWCDLFSFLAGC